MKFSIITIAFNSENTIERTIRSVMGQTYKDYEYIIIDGASKDQTLDVIKEYEPLFDGRLKFISERDKGIYDAMNKGVRMSSGDIIGIVNSDDWLEENALQVVADTVLDNKLDFNKSLLVTGWIDYHYEDGTHVVMKSDRERYEYYAKRLRMGINHPATFVSKAVYKEVGLFDINYKLFGDADFIVRCYRAKIDVIFVNNVLSNMSDGGASSSVTKKGFYDSVYRINKYYPEYRFIRILKKAKLCLTYFRSLLIPHTMVRTIRKIRNR